MVVAADRRGNRIRQTVSGVVAHANDRGFKFEGSEDWVNVSKYASDVRPPFVGQYVVVGLDKDGYARNIELGGTPGETSPPSSTRSTAKLTSVATDDFTVRLHALTLANALCSASLSSGETPPASAVIFIAQQYENYLSGQ